MIGSDPLCFNRVIQWADSLGWADKMYQFDSMAEFGKYRSSFEGIEVIFIDFDSPKDLSMEELSRLKKRFPNASIFLLVGFSDTYFVYWALMEGVAGVINKEFLLGGGTDPQFIFPALDKNE